MIQPQRGPQRAFLASTADITVYGGAAGGGKTWALLLEPLYHIDNPRFSAVIFRRTYPQIRNPGGLWDESMRVYPLQGATPHSTDLRWTFPSGAVVRFSHMQHEHDKLAWQGSQITLIAFDELTHFTETQFLYMLSRNRSLSGIRPYIRATTNPDADNWVKTFLAPWVDDEHPEFPFPAGALRWFTVENDSITWVAADWRDENGLAAKSMTFIPARVTDNRLLLRHNPEYMASLRALPFVEQQRLLYGDWKVRPSAGKVFNRAWFETVDVVPAAGVRVRFWDFAATEKKSAGDDPDWTVGLLLRLFEGESYVDDVVRVRLTPGEVKRLVRATASQDGPSVAQRWEVEPGSSGKFVSSELMDLLIGFDARGVKPVGDKVQRAMAAAAAALAGRIKVRRASWNADLVAELHGFPDLPHDDQVDALSGAFNEAVGLAELAELATEARVVGRKEMLALLD